MYHSYNASCDALDHPFRFGPRAFTIIHVNCPQHAHSCPKSHAPWLHLAAGQTRRIVSESVLRGYAVCTTTARGLNAGIIVSRTVTPKPLSPLGHIPFSFFSFLLSFYLTGRCILLDLDLRESNGRWTMMGISCAIVLSTQSVKRYTMNKKWSEKIKEKDETEFHLRRWIHCIVFIMGKDVPFCPHCIEQKMLECNNVTVCQVKLKWWNIVIERKYN